MLYSDVCVEVFGHALPDRIVSSDAIEKWLKPAYERLHLPEGRLELMTGIRERRFWPKGMMPSEASAAAARKALELADFARDKVECLLHCSVSRDFVEPATSTAVHRLLGLPSHALNFDISNACLGVLSGMLMLANMIQLGQVQAGLVVAGENSLPLVENTVSELVRNQSLTRRHIKPLFASLTIGSAAAAVLLTHRRISRTGHRLLGGAHACNTAFNHLCQGNADGAMVEGGGAMMQTQAEELLVQGVKVAKAAWTRTKSVLGWTNDTPDLICTHQVGRSHRDHLYSALELDPARDFPTVEFLGNCGSASLPVTASVAAEQGRLRTGDRLALLGIGSGINCTMLGVEW